MKKILFACVSVILLSSVTSCEDFLTEKPGDTRTSASYWQTIDQATAAVNRLYREGALTKIADCGNYLAARASVAEMLTGYYYNTYETQEIYCNYARLLIRQEYTETVSTHHSWDIWSGIWPTIGRANTAIKYIPNVKGDAAQQKVLIAEAKFFRAFNYFFLTKFFGDIPKVTEPYESLDGIYVPRVPQSEIFALIEEDLKAGVADLPDNTFQENGHRVSKYVAAQVLADVYMYEGKYADAASTAQILTKSGKYSLVTNDDLNLKSAFNKLRSQDDLPESVWAYERDAVISSSGGWPTQAFDAQAVPVFKTYSIFERAYGPTNRYLNVYNANDLRIQPNQFFHWHYVNPNDQTKIWNAGAFAGNWYFYDENALLNTGIGTKDWNFYRYAETLLDAAESIAQSTGVNAEAAGYLAQIKARADMNGKTVAAYTTELQALSKDNFIKECWNERLREMPLEMKMWDLCVRTKQFPNISKTTKGDIQWENLIGAQNGAEPTGATFKESDLLWPIPLAAIQRNPSLLPQNPGYDDK